jgi:hypothetical protein
LPANSAGVTHLWLLVASLACAVVALLLLIRLLVTARANRARTARQDGVDSMRDALERRLENSSEPWV